MTDLKIINLCAKAMEIKLRYPFGKEGPCMPWHEWRSRDTSDSEGALKTYDPLHDDVQAMALVKKFYILLDFHAGEWIATGPTTQCDADLNRAICESVAEMQSSKVIA